MTMLWQRAFMKGLILIISTIIRKSVSSPTRRIYQSIRHYPDIFRGNEKDIKENQELFETFAAQVELKNNNQLLLNSNSTSEFVGLRVEVPPLGVYGTSMEDDEQYICRSQVDEVAQ
jgi:hypothetical protein